MTQATYSTVFEPQLWVYVERILSRVPRHIDLRACRTAPEMIDTLGMNGAFDALRAYQSALQHFYSDAVFQALRAATLEPTSAPQRRGYGADPFDDATWAKMFDMTWRDSTPRRRKRRVRAAPTHA